ncbi:MAG: type 1 glutamine amidotransferase [Deltaproteobacteria bacterium]|nr:type 1 glutamine amidotransferase [Deltaproteobacteria bacterium]
MRAHYLQHVPFEGLGSIEPWLRTTGYEITHTKFFETTRLPYLDEFDLLVIMGGPMSVADESKFSWLVHEKQFIRSTIEAGKPVLGVCLGAQLIASSLGARIYKNHCKEIGWFPVQGIRPADDSTFRFPPSLDVFHWHGETFDLPASAIRLARSEGCENQAFQIGQSVIGLQFHLETTPESARELVSHCRAEMSPSKYVQSETTILAAEAVNYLVINNLMVEVLSFLRGIEG